MNNQLSCNYRRCLNGRSTHSNNLLISGLFFHLPKQMVLTDTVSYEYDQ